MSKKIKIYPPLWIPFYSDNCIITNARDFQGKYDRNLYGYIMCLINKGYIVEIEMANRIWKKDILEDMHSKGVILLKDELIFPKIPNIIGKNKNITIDWDIDIIFPLSKYRDKLSTICNIRKLNEYQQYRLSSLIYLMEKSNVQLLYPFLWLDEYSLDCLINIIKN